MITIGMDKTKLLLIEGCLFSSKYTWHKLIVRDPISYFLFCCPWFLCMYVFSGVCVRARARVHGHMCICVCGGIRAKMYFLVNPAMQ